MHTTQGFRGNFILPSQVRTIYIRLVVLTHHDLQHYMVISSTLKHSINENLFTMDSMGACQQCQIYMCAQIWIKFGPLEQVLDEPQTYFF